MRAQTTRGGQATRVPVACGLQATRVDAARVQMARVQMARAQAAKAQSVS